MDYEKNKLSDLRSYLEKEFFMDSDEIAEMLEIFFESINKLISTADSQLKDSTPELLSITGHTIKGSSANINATGISQLGLILEQAGKENDLSKCSEVVAALKEAITELHAEFKK